MAKRIIENDSTMMKDSIVAWIKFRNDGNVLMGDMEIRRVLPYKVRPYLEDAMKALAKIPPEGDESETWRIMTTLQENIKRIGDPGKPNLYNTKGRITKYEIMFDFY